MNEQGLAAQQRPAMDGSAQGNRQGMVQMVQEVAQAIMQGATPEQLMQQGVPAEVIQAAMELVASQTQAPQVPAEQAGLANTMVTQGGM